jgi:uncharacterized protein DUF3168
MTLQDIRVGLRAYLLDDATIAAAVDSGASASLRYRVFAVRLPQGETRASIVYSRISGQGDHHMEGASGLNRTRVQIDCWAQTADAADLLARQVKERIDGYRGSILWGEDSPAEAIVVQGIFFDSEREDFDETANMHRSSKDYLVWYEER